MQNLISDIRPVYSEVMEDYDPLSKAFSLKESDVLVSVASAGDNIFNAAIEKVRHIFGVDVNSLQIDFCRLKEAVITALPWEDFMQLTGVLDASITKRIEILNKVSIPVPLTKYLKLDSIEQLCKHGLSAYSHLEAFLKPLREGLLCIVGKNNMEHILTEPDGAIRYAIWQRHFESPEIVDFLGHYLNEKTISGSFIPHWAFSQMLEQPFHNFFYKAIKRQLVELNPTKNFFMHRVLLGRFTSSSIVPFYMRKENYLSLQQRLSCITWHTCDMLDLLKTLPPASVNAINLSNILDWCHQEHYQSLWEEVDRVASPGARVFLRSFIASKKIPQKIAASWKLDAEISRIIENQDRVGYYSRYELWTCL